MSSTSDSVAIERAAPVEPRAPVRDDRPDREAELAARYQTFARTRSIAETARAHGVSPAAISKQVRANGWREKLIATDRELRLTREARASQRHIEQIDRVEEIVEAELAAIGAEGDEDDEPNPELALRKVGMAVQVIERAQKIKATAHEALPKEPEPETDYSGLTLAQLELVRCAEELIEQIKAGKPGAPVEPKTQAVRDLLALIEQQEHRYDVR